MGCLFALLAAFMPRVALLILWIFTPYVERAFDTWLWPLAGLIFAPFTTLMYVFVVAPLGPTNFWGWLCMILAVFVDARNWYDAARNRRLPSYVPLGGSSAG